MTIHKTWNVRDQTTEALKEEAEKCYTMIVKYNRWINRAVSIEEAKNLVEEKFRYKAKANDIELELMKRRVEDEET